MDSTVIVALPSVDDKVNRISSEKVPHLTLCFLGDLSSASSDDLIRVVEYVEHAASQLSPFGLTVDYRGQLGPDAADVVFFEKNDWSYPRISDFRHHLLQDNTIRRLYEGVEQYPEWTPHLTLGYPETPAKEDDSDYPGINYVSFDRIAVWYGDFEGPTFRLKYEDAGLEVAMSDMKTTERGLSAITGLFHSGVKGMKWGVRKDEGHVGEKVKTKKLDKLDKQWENEMGRTAFIKLHNAAAEKMNNGGIDKINNKPEYKDVDFNDPKNSALYDKYLNEHETAFQQAMVEAGPSLGSNPSGTKAFVIKKVKDPDSGEEYEDVFLEPVGKDLKHAEGDTEIAYRLVRDDKGLVTSYEEVELELAHFGVKGMKWGVRKSESTGAPKERGKIKRGATKANTALNAGAKVIDKGEKKLIFLPAKARQEAASGTQTRMLGEAARINKDPKFKGKDLKRDAALKDAYFKEAEKAATKVYTEELAKARVRVAADVINAIMSPKKDSVKITAPSDTFRHDDSDETLLELHFEFDDLGQIKDVGVHEDYLEHSESKVLFHYGVKGMRWGVTTVDKASSVTLTREKKALRNTKDVTVSQRKAGTYAKARGGQRQRATDDAVKAVAARQKAKKSTTDALTNDELKAANERMRLEQEYHKLNAKTKRKGESFVARLFASPEARKTGADLAKRVAASAATA